MKLLQNKTYICLIVLTLFMSKNSYCQSTKSEIYNKIITQLDSMDNCLEFGVALASQTNELVYDTVFPFPSRVLKRRIYIKDDSMISLLNLYKDSLNTVLLLILKGDDIKNSWAANLMLFYLFDSDGSSLEKFLPNQCERWGEEKKDFYIKYWTQVLLK